MPVTHYVAWWNVENLFDEENAPRTDKLRRALGDSIKGWTPAFRDRKIAQLASVIAQMNAGAGPDLLGVCEVENRHVLTRRRSRGHRRCRRARSGRPGRSAARPAQRPAAAADSVMRAEADTVQILKFPGTVATGDYPKPRPFRLGGNPDQDGFSDHFPICLQVTEAD